MTRIAPPHKPEKISITIEPQGNRIDVRPEETVLDAAHGNTVKIASVCGGRGICKSCVIRFLDNNAPPPSAQDEIFFSKSKLAKGWRRACQTIPSEGSRIQVPERTRAQASRMFVAGNDIWVQPEPVVEAVAVTLNAPDLQDNISDAQRLIDSVNHQKPGICQTIDFHVLQTISSFLRQENWSVQAVVRESEIIGLLPVKCHILGLAIDLGTTNLAILLVDLSTGNTLASKGIENPQSIYGSDIIARISQARGKPDILRAMQRTMVTAINKTATELCAERNLDSSSIVDIVIAGNTAIHHFFMGLSVDYLGVAPFTAVIRENPDVKARDLGLDMAPGACLHAMDNIAGFVGGDHTAMLLGIRADQEKHTVIALDIGTNTEISLIHQGRIFSLSSPSGPALEGGNITCGMRAADGAIEGISVMDKTIKLKTIGNKAPIGLCGSAVLDAAAEFYKAGAINFRGQINKTSFFAEQRNDDVVLRLCQNDPDIIFTQQDVRNVQLAKGAIRAGIDLLLKQAGLIAEDLDRVIISGSFGVYIRLESAVGIGMLPNLPMNHFEQVGNAAAIGAKLALVSRSLRQKARALAASVTHYEQAGSKEFMRRFMTQIHFPGN